LPGSGNKITAPLLCIPHAKLEYKLFHPIKHSGFDPSPFILWQHLAVERWVFTLDGIGDQLALIIVYGGSGGKPP